jgi:hypothetical protein
LTQFHPVFAYEMGNASVFETNISRAWTRMSGSV